VFGFFDASRGCSLALTNVVCCAVRGRQASRTQEGSLLDPFVFGPAEIAGVLRRLLTPRICRGELRDDIGFSTDPAHG